MYRVPQETEKERALSNSFKPMPKSDKNIVKQKLLSLSLISIK
jgi:hypothetical protein